LKHVEVAIVDVVVNVIVDGDGDGDVLDGPPSARKRRFGTIGRLQGLVANARW